MAAKHHKVNSSWEIDDARRDQPRKGATYLNPTQLLKAIAFAANKHRDQRRKDAGASPYINHPIAVATVLAAEGDVSDEVTLIAAALHDTVEDTQTTFGELEEHFGSVVAGLVREVTDDKSIEKMERKRLQIEHARSSSTRAKQLKIADKICNVRDVTDAPPADWQLKRRRDYLDWAMDVVAGCRGVNARLDQAFDQAINRAKSKLGTG
jgi:GTP diphosphokinase / guanosine-3',5'-bis(diphosphate) 3'-diphosphatase